MYCYTDNLYKDAKENSCTVVFKLMPSHAQGKIFDIIALSKCAL